ncbi:AEC family transporter [Pseudomonas sp. RIT-PI-S]|uniref:AEC family transporter n=1 Tax=Pseudomonas sp. RIT-PI-S TaxID=3035295 RepID=UPI0021D8345C|nr:AEC family transporter [Pseudomonas sp. RIT-PI-S]
MEVLFNVVLPVFALVGAGWLTRTYGLLGDAAAFELNRFVVYLGMPALLFQVMATAKWADLHQPGFAAAFAFGSAVVFGCTAWLRRFQSSHLADASLDGLNSGYANVGFIGFPLCLAAFGPASLPLVTICAIITVSILFGIAVLMVEIALQPEGKLLSTVGKVGYSLLKNPMLLAPLLGVLYAAFAPPLPMGPNRFLTLLANAASPCALVSLGAFIAETKFEIQWPRLSSIVALKLVAQPLLTWIAATYMFDLNHESTAIAVVVAALPTGTGPYMLANLYSRDASITAGSVLVSTVVSMGTIALLVSVFTRHLS